MNSKQPIYLVVAIIFIANNNLWSQFSVVKYPVRSGYFPNYYVAVNPAFAGMQDNREVSLGNQRLLGSFSNVSTYFFNFNIRINPPVHSHDPFSCFGVYAYNDVEGRYINRSRFYGLYAWHGHITKKVLFSGGLAIGGMNYAVKGTSLSGSGSDWAADATLGFTFYGKTFYGGFSLNQMLNSKVQPLEEVTTLSPFLNISGGYRYKFSDIIECGPLVNLSYQTNPKKLISDLQAQFLIAGKYTLAGGIFNSNKIAITAGVKEINFTNGRLGINLTYAFPRNQAGIQTSISELGLSYLF